MDLFKNNIKYKEFKIAMNKNYFMIFLLIY